MKTPEETKRGMEQDCGECDEENFCPYVGIAGCIGILHKDALAYIRQLEADLKQEKADHQHTYECAEAFQKENAELLEKIKHLEQERDAAITDLRNANICICLVCANFIGRNPAARKNSCKVFGELSDEGIRNILSCGGFKWRGPCEENTENP